MKFSNQAESLIADLRQVPYSKTPAVLRDIIPLDDLLETLFERYQIGKERIEDTVMRHWRDIVGTEAAHRCRPQKIVDGKRLVIITTNAVLRQELSFRKRDILQRLRQIPDCECLEDIVVRAG